MDETLKLILAELQKTNNCIDALSADVQEIKTDTKQIKEQVNTLYEWVDNIEIDVKDLKNIHSA